MEEARSDDYVEEMRPRKDKGKGIQINEGLNKGKKRGSQGIDAYMTSKAYDSSQPSIKASLQSKEKWHDTEQKFFYMLLVFFTNFLNIAKNPTSCLSHNQRPPPPPPLSPPTNNIEDAGRLPPAARCLGFQQPGSVYGFLDARGDCKRVRDCNCGRFSNPETSDENRFWKAAGMTKRRRLSSIASDSIGWNPRNGELQFHSFGCLRYPRNGGLQYTLSGGFPNRGIPLLKKVKQTCENKDKEYVEWFLVDLLKY
ncbi:hypothetical protein M9H77_17698 [Catharanthus roseus]|uniref:Uncharacterized protein n=1 Tax=Catharanthus roseus TaxID=4058 RepID=A0ACC0B5C8_CATRO|nr:hypothetical protein M9H77_17698 [Catharanthus roseus]